METYGPLMSLTLYLHPLASFCHKVLIALYENDIPFEASLVDFSNPGSAAAHIERWPVGKIPVLHNLAEVRQLSVRRQRVTNGTD